MRPFRLGDRTVGPGEPPLVVAELSGNHDGDLERALAIVDAAAVAGAHALKLQTYTADSMTIDVERPEFRIDDPASPWHGSTLYELYHRAHTPWSWHVPLVERCRERGLIAFSTPFDEQALRRLESLDMPCYKIASFEIVDLPLIRLVAATGKPLVISTGMATVAEIDEAVRTAREGGCRDLVLLQCTSTYPASPADSALATIPDLARRFDCQVGLSDHTPGIGCAVAAVALGATVIEKHLTLRRADGGVDAAFSLEPDELRALVVETARAREAIGVVRYGPSAAERGSLRFRRSLYVVRDLAAGQVVTADHVRAIRPGHGLPPRELERVLGRRAARDVPRGTPVAWELFD